MQESKPTQTTFQDLPPKPPNPTPPPPPQTKKRPLDGNSHFQISHYYKMRAIVKGLRPRFLEVLQVPNFRNSEAACEIREKMNHLMDLYKELTAETDNIEKSKNAPEVPSPNQVPEWPKPRELSQDGKHAEHLPSSTVNKPTLSGNVSEKQQYEDDRMQGTYIVGGSAFGWNFITYGGGKTVYYGRTKESFRAANVVSQ